MRVLPHHLQWPLRCKRLIFTSTAYPRGNLLPMEHARQRESLLRGYPRPSTK
jgi:hypothetical protein